AGSRVFAVGDDQINAFLRYQVRKTLANDFAARRSNNVSDEKYAHKGVVSGRLSFSDSRFRKTCRNPCSCNSHTQSISYLAEQRRAGESLKLTAENEKRSGLLGRGELGREPPN